MTPLHSENKFILIKFPKNKMRNNKNQICTEIKTYKFYALFFSPFISGQIFIQKKRLQRTKKIKLKTKTKRKTKKCYNKE